ncbi:hypothetical protein [Vibrio phage vB_VcM_SY]
MKWFSYSQNNSGGYFIRNDIVADYVLIQAESAEIADEKMLELSSDYCESCPCCGDRWWIDSRDESGTDEPMYYTSKIREKFDPIFSKEAFAYLYHADGKKEKILPTE